MEKAYFSLKKAKNRAKRALWKPKVGVVVALAFSLAVLPFFFGVQEGKADAIDDLNNQIDQLQGEIGSIDGKIGEYEAKLAELEGQATTLENEIAKFNLQIEKKDAEIDKTEQDIAKTEAEIERLSLEITQKEEEIKYWKGVLADLIRQIREYDHIGIIEILLSGSFSDSLNKAQAVLKLQNKGQEVMTNINRLRDELLAKKAEQEARREELATLKTTLDNQRQELADQKEKKESLLAQVNANEEEFQDFIAKSKQQKAALGAEIAAIEDEIRNQYSPPSGDGVFGWPVSAPIVVSAYYGYSPEYFNGQIFHTGIDFVKPTGSPAYAVEPGVVGAVISSAYGYGNHIILVHDGGLTTVYGHLSGFNVSVGQTVDQGDLIGFVGSTGWSTGPHLHFEARQNGVHFNPWPYFQ